MLPGHDAVPLSRDFGKQIARAFRKVPGLLASAGILGTSGGSLSGAINEARASVAGHATDTPIWAAAGNAVEITGTPTITDFPDAPQAGSVRRIFPAAGTIITDNANISVQGGASCTFAAGDWAFVEALTTATFAVTIFSAGGVVAPGAIQCFAMDTEPAGWLEADGALLSRTTYAGLFAAIGTTYGVGDGSTTFALPDYRGEFLRGWDNGRGVDTGRVFGTAQTDALQNATGQLSNALFNSGSVTDGVLAFSSSTNANLTGGGGIRNQGILSIDLSRQVRTATETRGRNVAVLICIKY